MKDPKILARCNLFGVMKNLECLAAEDEEFRQLAGAEDISVQFLVKGGPSAHLSIKGGDIRLKEGRYPSNATLYFRSPQHFNDMVDGKANPIPLKGFTRLKFLTGPFSRMTEILEKYLRLPENEPVEPQMLESNTALTAYAAFFSIAEIANHDPVGKACAAAIPDGVIQVAIENGPGIQLHAQGGILTAQRGRHENPRAVLSFRDTAAAHAVLNGKADTFTSLALGDMEMKGFIPMIEHMNPILDMVAFYLN